MRKLRWTTFPSLAAKTQLAIRFVVARQLLGGVEGRKFRPNDPLSDADWNDAVESLGEYDIDLKTEAKPATRAEAAVVLKTAIQTALGTAIESPYTNEYLTRDRIRIGAWVNPRAGGDRKGFHRNVQFRRIRLDHRPRRHWPAPNTGKCCSGTATGTASN